MCDWEAIKATTPSETSQTICQRDPVPAEGGLVKRGWFDDHRISTAPPVPRKIVAVSPADSGHGDEAGIVVLGLDREGCVYLLADHSGQPTSYQWARRAV